MAKNKRILTSSLFFILFAFGCEPGSVGRAQLSWSPPFFDSDGGPLTDLRSYRVYVQRDDITVEPLEVPSIVVGVTIHNLDAARYSFWVTAVDTSGNESIPSAIRYKLVR